MSVFEDNEATRQRLDYEVLRFSPVALFWRPQIFQKYTAWFADHGYRVVSFDGATWNSEETFHKDLEVKLDFPGYYGRNLDALNDCLRDLDLSGSEGQVIAVQNYHVFTQAFPHPAHAFLDILADRAWNYLLFGNRLVTLVQTDDADAEFGPLGAKGAYWNREEWLNSDRGLSAP